MAKYSFIDKLYHHRALVKKNGKYGFIDENNIEIIALQYDDAYPFETDEFTFVRKGDLWGGIDISGNVDFGVFIKITHAVTAAEVEFIDHKAVLLSYLVGKLKHDCRRAKEGIRIEYLRADVAMIARKLNVRK